MQIGDLGFGAHIGCASSRSFAACRFWLIMMIGACKAASMDSIRLRKMNGKGSKAWPASTALLSNAQATMNRRLPVQRESPGGTVGRL